MELLILSFPYGDCGGNPSVDSHAKMILGESFVHSRGQT